MLKWGDLHLGRTGKQRSGAWELDYSLRYLGYSTDNGANCSPPYDEHDSLMMRVHRT